MTGRKRIRVFETLERRELMATDLLVAGECIELPKQPVDAGAMIRVDLTDQSKLIIEGTDMDDLITVEQQGDKITARVSDIFRRHVLSEGTFPASQIDQILIDAGPGHDYVTNYSDVSSRIRGGPGHDELHGGSAGDEIFGDGGEDFIYGHGGKDELYGGVDSDLISGDGGADDIWGQLGNDNLYGGADYDHLYGGDGNDRMYGQGGHDNMYGEKGNDQLYGGDYHDNLYGGNGDDRLYGGEGRDGLLGGEGDDRLYGGIGNDDLIGGFGLDYLNGGPDDDRLTGGPFAEYVDGVQDIIWGGSGHDRFVAAARYETIGVLVHRSHWVTNFIQTGHRIVIVEQDSFMDLTSEDTVDKHIVEYVRVITDEIIDY